MALTKSSLALTLGAPMPPFRLQSPATGAWLDSADLSGRPVLLVFACNHCPYVVHVAPVMAALGRECAAKGVAMVAINSNDPENYREDAPQHMGPTATRFGWDFPYLFDETQGVARAFDAQCTPDWYLFDRSHRLFYRGCCCESTPGNGIPPTGNALRAALTAMLAGGEPPREQSPSMGCNVKWRAKRGGRESNPQPPA